jgi:dipeptidyl aminopeptidase/acylaminoacyl peptidase
MNARPALAALARLCACLALPAWAPLASAAEPFTATEMMKLKRLADPQLAPDGSAVAYALTEVDLAGQTRNSDLWLSPLQGGEPRRLTSNPASDSRPRFSPDGRTLAFLSTRDGSAQVWQLDLAGGEPRKLTSLATGVDAFEWLGSARLALVSEVFPDCGADDACNAKRLAEAGKPSSARAYDELLYRHWDTWDDGRRSHVLALTLATGALVDLTPGGDDAPPFNLGGEDWGVAPDGSEVCVAKKDAKGEAWHTNAELYLIPAEGGEAKRISDSPGYDSGCRYSPDGRLLAYRSMARAGYEADRFRLVLFDRATGERRSLAESFDRSVDPVAFSPDGKTIYFTAEDNGHSPVFEVSVSGGPVTALGPGPGSFSDLSVTRDGRTIVATHATLTFPSEVVRFGADGKGLSRVTRVNDAQLASHALRPGESVSYTGAAGKSVQAWVVRPPAFDAARPHPLLVLVHGGPQGAWPDGWTWRWNAQVFAAAGYVVFMPNPRGSTGFGQAFTDDIRSDWGGKAYEDVMKGAEFALQLPGVDKTRAAAAGGSYGGYMVNWIAGHTDRFRALVTHSGVFDLVSMYGSTEELWFPEWEFGGPFWSHPEGYRRFNPRDHVASFKTPTLVVHGERDYRVPLEQGLAMFTALRRQGVPARLLTFPDENHWILKPHNAVRWYQEVIGWLDRYTKP